MRDILNGTRGCDGRTRLHTGVPAIQDVRHDDPEFLAGAVLASRWSGRSRDEADQGDCSKGAGGRQGGPSGRSDLQSDPKERAENLMITDLIRHDLLGFCVPGSVRVARLFGLESVATVHSLVSTTVLELHHPRGPYSGILGFIAIDGRSDMSVVIRTAIIRNNHITVGAEGLDCLPSDHQINLKNSFWVAI
ncbi:Protein phosphatase PP2A regulatory subunit B [Puccinia graminis f. sp. tritici]|uniref:Protein phosphatase PP2A regulatory subunit B n=1 Tax=Puccinia graminis f. sp. tritici TaxID=56615 RepID=A0A5B0R2K0_PUCGR|nr:Protein phosphatase PP2A regulatory subunit B [Puccinia graminis f. sp. tritici]